jgi:prepilin-type N-terminal cleavage/methylation domain-containing protein
MVRGRKTERGMTLVEIMVTLIISSIIAASTFMFFAGQQRVYEAQIKVLNIQQNLWAATEVVTRHVRAAGSGMHGCVKPASYANVPPAPNPWNGSRLSSTFPSDGPLTPNLGIAPPTGIRAFSKPVNGMQWIPPLWIVNNSTDYHVAPGTDIVTVAFGNLTSGSDVDATLAINVNGTYSALDFTLAGANAGNIFRPGDFILLLVTPDWGFGTDPVVDRGCTLFQVTLAGNMTLSHTESMPDNTTAGWNPSADVPAMLPVGGYVSGSSGVRNFGQLTWVTFFIQVGENGIPSLMMRQRHFGGEFGQAELLAEGIEDLQVSFACDTGPLGNANLSQLDGQLNEGNDDASRRTDEWWNNVPDDILPMIGSAGYCNLPTAVRVTLVARSLTEDDLIDTTGNTNGPLNIEDHRYPSPTPDKFRRRVLSTTVYPRNNKPL